MGGNLRRGAARRAVVQEEAMGKRGGDAADADAPFDGRDETSPHHLMGDVTETGSGGNGEASGTRRYGGVFRSCSKGRTGRAGGADIAGNVGVGVESAASQGTIATMANSGLERRGLGTNHN